MQVGSETFKRGFCNALKTLFLDDNIIIIICKP